MTISACFLAHNDLPFLRMSLAYARAWADQICVLDMASDDGTAEFCAAFLSGSDRYLRLETNTVPILGDARGKNTAAEMAYGDWVVNLDADLIVHWEDARKLRDLCESTEEEIIWSHCYDVPDEACALEVWQTEKAVKEFPPLEPHSRHGKIYRRTCGYEFQGYLHAELYRAETNWSGRCGEIGVRMLHFSKMRPMATQRLRVIRGAWMMRNASQNPDLQRWTNRWWYDVYWPKERERLEVMAEEYEKLLKEGVWP